MKNEPLPNKQRPAPTASRQLCSGPAGPESPRRRSPAPTLLVLALIISIVFATPSIAQSIVKGTVSDEAGNAMPGVNVVVKGTSNGTTTDSNGLYNVSIADNNAVLVFSFIGYGTQELAL